MGHRSSAQMSWEELMFKLATALLFQDVSEMFQLIGPSTYELVNIDKLRHVCCEWRLDLVRILPVLF